MYDIWYAAGKIVIIKPKKTTVYTRETLYLQFKEQGNFYFLKTLLYL